MAGHPEVDNKIKELAYQITIVAKEYVDRVEAFKELLDNEWISEEVYVKTMQNDLEGMLRDLKTYTDVIRGYN